MKNIKKVFAATLISGLIHSPAFASTDGALAASSTGTVGITMAIPTLVKISGLSDIVIAVPSTTPDGSPLPALESRINFCVYSNVASGAYAITATGDNGDTSAFGLTNGDGSSIDYKVFLENTKSTTSPIGDAVVTAVKKPFTTGGVARDSAITCNSEDNKNATLWVRIDNGQAFDRVSGNYIGALTLTVAAN